MSAEKLKHTPGPWKTPGHDIPNVHVYGSGRFPAIVAYCPALVNAGGAGTAPDERVANAKLIASAPDLLAALELLLTRADSIDQSATHDGLQNIAAIVGARYAIAKAKGEA